MLLKYSSKLDQSLNFMLPSDGGSFFEARLVLREQGKAIVYISSQDGCSQGCRMCYLTRQRQRRKVDASICDVLSQVKIVVDALSSMSIPLSMLHFNFMARGDVFSNEELIQSWDVVEGEISEIVLKKNFTTNIKILISTIFPKKTNFKSLDFVLKSKITNIYYSYYSSKVEFRKYWIPNSRSVGDVCDFLREFHGVSGRRPRFHFCFIENQNDSFSDLDDLVSISREFSPFFDVNIVRFNPPPGSSFKESAEGVIERNVSYLKAKMTSSRIKIISRVGYDVKASCGMFMEDVNV